MTDRIPLNDMTSDQLDQLHDEIGRLHITNRALNTAVVEAVERAERAEAEARAWAEAESADIAAGSYAGRVQELEAELAALRAVARGYCPTCGRGDAAPTVADWERERRRANEAEQRLARIVKGRPRGDAVQAEIGELIAQTHGLRDQLRRAEAAHAQTIDSMERAVRRARRAEAVIEAVAEILADHNGDEWSRHPATEAVASALRLPPTPTAATQATEERDV